MHAGLVRFFEFHPGFPATRLPMLMENRDHNRHALAANEIRGIRKMMEQRPSHTGRDFRELIRKGLNSIDPSREFLDEANADLLVLPCIPSLGVLDVDLGLASDNDRDHFPGRVFFRSSARTSSQGRPASGLASRSARRSSRIARCHSGTGTRSSLAAIRSHSA